MSAPRIGELFSGYGGLGMGVQSVYGGTIAWHSDIDKGACKILAHRYPDVPNIGDITTVDWSQVEPVDILTGGSPCQDLSHAGRRAGMTDGTRSNLWVAMREAIAQLRPTVVVWENVRGAYSAAADSAVESCSGCVGDGSGVHLRALGRVLGDLSDLGYDCRWHGLRAADVGAPHGRFRVFVVATDAQRGQLSWQPVEQQWASTAARGGRVNRCGPALLPTPRSSDSNGAGAHGTGGLDLRTTVGLLPTPRATDGTKGGPNQRGSSGDLMLSSAVAMLSWHEVQGNQPTSWGDYAAAIARWERALDRPAPAPTMTSKKGSPQLSPAFVEWLMGLTAGWVTDVPGITRNEALKALGNGVVSQQCAAALRVMESWEAAA